MYIQTSLFELTRTSLTLGATEPLVKGLTYVREFITIEEERLLLQEIDAGTWLNDLKRRVQHFGYKYNYKARRIDLQMRIGKLPIWLEKIAQRLYAEGFFEQCPDQVIVNEYEPGQGISPHIDCEPCFANTVISLSLNSAAVMEFSRLGVKVPYLLEPRSIVMLSGESRYDWMHCIPARKKDVFNGMSYNRKRRVSLTFRKVVL